MMADRILRRCATKVSHKLTNEQWSSLANKSHCRSSLCRLTAATSQRRSTFGQIGSTHQRRKELSSMLSARSKHLVAALSTIRRTVSSYTQTN